MFARWRAAGLLLPTFLTALALPILIGLGVWQIQRKAWKESLIAKIEARTHAEPVTLSEAVRRAAKNLEEVEYLRVTVTGNFRHDQERYVYEPTTRGSGWNVYTPLEPSSGNGRPTVVINRGWVPDDKRAPDVRSAGQVTGEVSVTGLLRAPQAKSWFTPENDVAGNRWYSRDLPEIAATLPESLHPIAPFFIDAEAMPENPGGWPRGGTTKVHLSNPHLQYVVTWFGLALTLIGVFTVFARQRLREMSSESEI